MKRKYSIILYTIILSALFSCRNENAEELFYSSLDKITDTLLGEKILIDIPFNNSIKDVSDNKLDVKVYGHPSLTYDRFNKKDHALYLNGDDQYIEFDINKQDSIAISFWFKSASSRSCLSSIFDYGANAVRTNVDAYTGPTKFQITTFYNNLDDLQIDEYLNYDTWFHIYLTACSNPVIYINGEKLGEIKKDVIINLTSTKLVFGKSINKDTDDGVYFHGDIDDIKIYNFLLTELEINELYGNYSPM